ncbi:MAG: hypothetical protein GX660_23775 [Clostridiaceae bacterium]|nr:hypothetical protein [Clostridiaceae bacterium]
MNSTQPAMTADRQVSQICASGALIKARFTQIRRQKKLLLNEAVLIIAI